ncbi:MAG: Maf family protein [Anaerolineae bacterium]|nr:Maf family protein [Anaerolineae bacterium]
MKRPACREAGLFVSFDEMVTLLLASASPRRQELIRLLGYPTAVQVPDVDEDSIDHADPAHNVVETARLKAEAVAATVMDQAIIVAADTTVALGREMLNKPANAEEARHMLRRLRGRTHQVHTGIVVVTLPERRTAAAVSTTAVTMRDYSDDEMEAYIASGDPFDKAGAYAIQNKAFRPVGALAGCFTGVMGLSLCRLSQALQAVGIPAELDVANHDTARCATCLAYVDTLF